MPGNDFPDGGGATPGPSNGPMDFNVPKPPPPNAVKYDAEGYPLPSADDIEKFNYTWGRNPTRAADGSTYDPSVPPPEPFDVKKHHNYDQWLAENKKRTYNQQAKQAWQKTHADQKQAAPAQQAAPATPFASAGIDLTKEGKGESHADAVLSYYGEHGIPIASNDTKVTLDKFRESQPQDLSPYYDYASKLTSAKIDNAMSSRGSYGSSNATGQIGAAEMALRAEEANANAKYGLDRYSMEGNLAGSSDATDARKNALEFSWAKGLNDIARGAQDAGQDRSQMLFDNTFKVAEAKAGNYTDASGKAITGVGEATDAANDALMGNASDQVSHANADANQDASAAASLQDAAKQGVTGYTNFKTREAAEKAAETKAN